MRVFTLGSRGAGGVAMRVFRAWALRCGAGPAFVDRFLLPSGRGALFRTNERKEPNWRDQIRVLETFQNLGPESAPKARYKFLNPPSSHSRLAKCVLLKLILAFKSLATSFFEGFWSQGNWVLSKLGPCDRSINLIP